MGRRIGLLLASVAVVAWFGAMAVYQVDDAYIVYRYASNLAHGEGFVFNPGERVEGVTCFLWAVALAPFALARIPLPVAAPILTAMAGLGIVALVPGLSARLAGKERADGWGYAAAGLLAAHPSFAYWSVGGLETVPYALLLLLALRDQIAEQGIAPACAPRSGRRSAWWAGVAGLVRPETPLVALGLLAGRLADGPGRGRRGKSRDLLLWAGAVALFLVPFLLFRRLYFDDWLPNTYYAKTGRGLGGSLQAGRLYSLAFLASLAPGFGSATEPAVWIGVGILIALLAYGLPRPGLRSAALLTAAVGAAVLLEGGDWMFLHRFWVPALPPLVLLLAAAARSAASAAPALRRAAAAGLALLAASFVVAGLRERDGPNGLRTNAAGYRFAHHRVAAFLRERGVPGDTVALMDVGIIGYESGLRVLDISGLTDPRVARAPGGFLDKHYPVRAILAERPRFFVLVDRFPLDDAIRDDPVFRRDYRLVLERNHRYNWTPPGSYVLHVYERRE
jgi:arabinofuranosyltransferase